MWEKLLCNKKQQLNNFFSPRQIDQAITLTTGELSRNDARPIFAGHSVIQATLRAAVLIVGKLCPLAASVFTALIDISRLPIQSIFPISSQCVQREAEITCDGLMGRFAKAGLWWWFMVLSFRFAVINNLTCLACPVQPPQSSQPALNCNLQKQDQHVFELGF